MLNEKDLAKECAETLAALTLRMGPMSLEDCREVSETMIGTALMSIAVNVGFEKAITSLGAALANVSEQLGIEAKVEFKEEPLCSTPSH